MRKVRGMGEWGTRGRGEVGGEENPDNGDCCSQHKDAGSCAMDKLELQHDGTEDAIAEQLIAKGVPKHDIVLAYHAPHVQQYTEFAIG